MERRALRTFEKQWPQAEHDKLQFFVTSVGGTFEQYIKSSQSYEQTLNGMVGDLERIITYPAQGFMISSDVPDQVVIALEILKNAGYSARIK